ncbi:MAG: tyrosine--tRNA ligase [Chloroflexi bacterium]|nr:tyrosine--tRNA ligase [Chloroflexota bacterium]
MNIEEQVATLMQGTDYGDEELKKAMGDELRERLIEAQSEDRPLRVYCGYDPRTADLHIGHTITMRKLRQFQDLGHQVIFLVGTYTSLIGDPSDKDKLRKTLTLDEVEKNAETYAHQAFRVLERTKTLVEYNDKWLAELTLKDLIEFASNFTIQQFLTRENFKLRFNKKEAIYLHETFYSIMQAYDAYKLKADVQVGGTDQLFNIITAARKLMTALGEKPNIGIIMGILPGTDGEVRMSKSLGNHIPLNTDAEDMYGKVMSVPDKAMPLFMRLVTRWTASEVEQIEITLGDGSLHPRDAKMNVAREITAIFYGEEASEKAEGEFVAVFQKGELPDDIADFKLQAGQTILDVLVAGNLVTSKSEGRRLIKQNGIRLDGETLTDANQIFPHNGVLQAGKRRFLRVVE